MTLPIQQDRLVQLLMKGDQTLGLDAARIRLERASVVITADETANTPWGHAALLTAAECAVRSFRGGVYLKGEFDWPARVGNWMPLPLRTMLTSAGCRTEEAPEHAVAVHFGTSPIRTKAKLYCWTDGWVAMVGPTAPSAAVLPGNELSGALAGAMIVTESFRLAALGDLLAGKRTQRLSPLTPQNPNAKGMELALLPSSLWLLGLGNLGQAVLWVLGLMPYSDPSAVKLLLQDLDVSAPENQDVQILTKPQSFGLKKARAFGQWAEGRGFRTTISEIPFGPRTVREEEQPGLALIGVDNIRTRRLATRSDVGFDLVLDAGLGATPSEVFDIRIHGFPGSRSVSQAWPDVAPTLPPEELAPDLVKLVSQGRLDRCGAFSIAGQSVGVPGTAVAAATMQIAQACRAINDARYCDVIDVSLENTARSTASEHAFGNARLLLFEEARTSN